MINRIFSLAPLSHIGVILTILLPTALYAQQPIQKIISRFIIIGDAGRLQNGKNVVVEAATKYISATDSSTTFLFLGDNIYPKGLPDEEDKTYASSAAILKAVITPFKDYQAKIYFVP